MPQVSCSGMDRWTFCKTTKGYPLRGLDSLEEDGCRILPFSISSSPSRSKGSDCCCCCSSISGRRSREMLNCKSNSSGGCSCGCRRKLILRLPRLSFGDGVYGCCCCPAKYGCKVVLLRVGGCSIACTPDETCSAVWLAMLHTMLRGCCRLLNGVAWKRDWCCWTSRDCASFS